MLLSGQGGSQVGDDITTPLPDPTRFADTDQNAAATSSLSPPNAPFSLGDPFTLSSRPSATKTIYLDFDGATTGGYWADIYSSDAPFDTPVYDSDGDATSFSDTELAEIQEMVLRVADDFSPFDVNVTTAEPPALDLMNNGDGRWGVRVIVGGSGDWYGPRIGGVANVFSFSLGEDREAFVFSGNVVGTQASNGPPTSSPTKSATRLGSVTMASGIRSSRRPDSKAATANTTKGTAVESPANGTTSSAGLPSWGRLSMSA